MRYPDLTDEEIERMRSAISNTLSNMKKDVRKDKLKVFGKTLLASGIASGIAISIIFPNLITIGVLGGAATLIAQNSNVFGKVKKIKEKSKEKKKNKEEVKNMAVEQHNCGVAKDVQSIIYQQEIRNNQAEPSAPELYPDLKKKF